MGVINLTNAVQGYMRKGETRTPRTNCLLQTHLKRMCVFQTVFWADWLSLPTKCTKKQDKTMLVSFSQL